MTASVKKIKVLCLGNIQGKNRINFILQTLLLDPRDGPYTFTLVSPSFCNVSTFSGKSIFRRVLSRLLNLPSIIFTAVEFFYKGLFTDVVVLLPASWGYFPLALWLRRIRKVKICVDLYISSSETYLDRNPVHTRSKRLLEKTARFDRDIIENADLVIFTARSDLQIICERLGVEFPEDRLQIIPQCTEPRAVANPHPSEIFRLSWWGMVSPIHGLPALLDAAEILLSQKFPFMLKLFCLPYPEDEVAKCQQDIEQRGLVGCVQLDTKSTFTNGLLEKQLIEECDLALGHFASHSVKSKTILTTKVVDSLSMGLPVLTRDTVVTRELIDVENELFLVEPEGTFIAQAIMKIANDPKELKRRAALGRKRWEMGFSKQSFIEKFDSCIKNLHGWGECKK